MNQAAKYQQDMSSKRQVGKLALTPTEAISIFTLMTLFEGQALAQAAAKEKIRKFGTQSTDRATATNGNIKVDVAVVNHHISQDLCPFGDYFGCAKVQVTLTNTTTDQVAHSFSFGMNLQSLKHTVVDKNGRSHQENDVDAATLAYARDCLQDADSYIAAFNKTAAVIVAQHVASQYELIRGWSTPANKGMYVSVVTTEIADATYSLLQGVLGGVALQCEVEGSKKAAQLYGLVALVAIPVIGGGLLAYGKYTTGSFFGLCRSNSSQNAAYGNEKEVSRNEAYNAGNTLPDC